MNAAHALLTSNGWQRIVTAFFYARKEVVKRKKLFHFVVAF